MTTPLPAPTPPPLGGAPRTGWGTRPPTGLAASTIGLTALATVLNFFSAPGMRDVLAHYSDFGRPDYKPSASAMTAFALYYGAQAVMVAAFITLAMWMVKTHQRLVAAGETPRLGPVWAWVGWIIPLANAVIPYLVFRGLNRRARSWAVLPWWIAWVGFWVIPMGGAIVDFARIDWASFASNPSTDPLRGLDLPTAGSAYVIAAYVLIAAWVLLAISLRQITARDVKGRAANAS